MADDKERRKCKARNRQGNRCGNPPEKGQLVCRLHGGSSPQAVANAAKRLAEEEVTRQVQAAVERFEIVPIEDPLTALKTLAGEVWVWKDAIANIVFEMKTIRYSSDFGDQLRAEIMVFERALDRCLSVLATIAKLKIDERLAAVSEMQLTQLTDGLIASYEKAGLTIHDADKKEAVAAAFASHLAVIG